jgi:CheY-like chemotaxis protein
MEAGHTTDTDTRGVVLVVDDDEGIRETLKLALELENHPVVLASDGVEALAWLRGHRSPSLILMDLMMPRMDGWQLLEQLRADDRLKDVPVVTITAFGRDLGSAGEIPVLRKPIELDNLLQVVATHSKKEL